MRRWLGSARAAWLLGVALPLAMVAFDPAVFRSTMFGVGMPILGRFKPFGYTAIGAGVAIMVVAMLTKRRLAVVAGALAGGCLFSIALGLAIVPFSALGIVVLGLGLLGFSPFVSGVVFAWQAVRTYREAAQGFRLPLAALGMVLFLGIPLAVQLLASAALKAAVADIVRDHPDVERGVARLRPWAPVLDSDEFVAVWNRHTTPDARQRLAGAYTRVFGGSLEERAGQLVD